MRPGEEWGERVGETERNKWNHLRRVIRHRSVGMVKLLMPMVTTPSNCHRLRLQATRGLDTVG